MLFKRKSAAKSGRVRQPLQSERTNAQPVFSYHARSARTETSGVRKASKLLWVNPPAKQPSAARKQPHKWSRRALAAGIAFAVVALVGGSIFLSRDPMVVALADTPGRQALLRSQETYQEAARAIFGESLVNATKLTVDTARVAQEMEARFPELAAVSVTLPIFGRQPLVYVQPSEPALIFKAGGQVFILDDKGRAVGDSSRVARLKRLNLPVVEDQSSLTVTIGQRALPGDSVEFITEVVNQLRAKKITVTALTLPRGTSELDVRVEGAKYIAKFNLKGDVRVEAGAFLAVRQYLADHKKSPVSYIDLRVDNRAYYK